MKETDMKRFLAGILACLMLAGGESMANDTSWDKTFPKSERVTVQKVTFKNRYGITLTGDLYLPRKTSGKLPAIAVSGPFGAVKEQASGLYAQTLAERGFIALAFDPSFTGESGGEPRSVASPDINTEDYSAAVDFLENGDLVIPEAVGILGICGFGGFALNAAAMDTRIKGTATSTMYDMTRVTARGYNDSMNADARHEMKKELNSQRTRDYKNGSFAPGPGLPEKLTGQEPQFVKDYWDYYKTKRGFHERSINSNGAWNATSVLSMMNMPILAYSSEIRSPVMIIHGEKAHSRYFSEDAFKKLTGDNKELLIVKDASHTDLYDNPDRIPFDKIAGFFRKNLK